MAALPTDLQQLKAQLSKTLGDASVVVKSSCVLVVLLYLLSFIPSFYTAVAVTPGFLIPPNFKLWTLFTAGFVEYRFWNVLIDIAVLALCGRVIEPLWGALEFLKFVTILNVGTSVLTALVCLICYTATFNTDLWFLQFGGMSGILTGITVAFKQIQPEGKLLSLIPSIRVKHVTSLVILLYIVMVVLNLLPLLHLSLVFFGALVGWVYLRFYQPRAKGVRGDLSDGFAFATFFPDSLQGPVNILSVITFNILVQLKVCSKPVRTYDVGAPSSITINLPGMDPADAERRRQKALKALNERLKKLEQPITWPTLEDASPTKPQKPSEIPDEEVPEVVVQKNTVNEGDPS